jgi:hypothetical protein
MPGDVAPPGGADAHGRSPADIAPSHGAWSARGRSPALTPGNATTTQPPATPKGPAPAALAASAGPTTAQAAPRAGLRSTPPRIDVHIGTVTLAVRVAAPPAPAVASAPHVRAEPAPPPFAPARHHLRTG